MIRCCLILVLFGTLFSKAGAKDNPGWKGLDELRKQVIKLESELQRIQNLDDDNKALRPRVDDKTNSELRARIDLAEAQGRLALAERRWENASKEFAEVVAVREMIASRYLKSACPIPDIWRSLRKQVAYARARLAEVEGQPGKLTSALREALDLQRSEVQTYQRLLQFGACGPELDAKRSGPPAIGGCII
jgi:hypothetical protein